MAYYHDAYSFCFYAVFSFFGFAGRKFHSYLGYGRIIGTNLRVGIGTARMDRDENVSYMMLMSDGGFFGGCGAYPFDCHCSDNGDYRSFRGVLSFHRGRWVDLLFHRIVTR